MTVSVRHDLETCYPAPPGSAGYVSLMLVKEDGRTFFEVEGGDRSPDGITFCVPFPFEAEEEAKEEYLKRLRRLRQGRRGVPQA